MKYSIALVAAALFVSSTVAQSGLSFEVPPPACLRTCMAESTACKLCTDDGKSATTSCLTTTCGPKDYSYASAYFGSVCQDGGYISYDTQPPHDVYIPGDDCAPTTKTVRRGRILRN